MKPNTIWSTQGFTTPPPRVNLVHYEGVFAPRHHLRRRVVSDRPSAAIVEQTGSTHPTEFFTGAKLEGSPLHPSGPQAGTAPDVLRASPTPARPPARPPEPTHRNYRGAELLRHTFEVDVLECDRYGGRMKLIAAMTDPDTIEAVTSALEEDADPIEPRPARPPPDNPMVDVDVQREQSEDVQLDLWPDGDDEQRDWR